MHRNHSDAGPDKSVYLSAFDVQKITSGIQKERGYIIGSATVQEVIAIHAKARKQFKRPKLRWRKSSGSKEVLDLSPLKVVPLNGKMVRLSLPDIAFLYGIVMGYLVTHLGLALSRKIQEAEGVSILLFRLIVRTQPAASLPLV